MKDHEIIALYWERDEAAITATAEKYGSYCHSISYNILHSNEDAEECVNDAYLGAWRSIPPQRPECLSSYLGKIVRNLSLNRYKKYNAQKRGLGQVQGALSELEDCIPTGMDIEQMIEEKALVRYIEQFLYAQPKQKRNIFVRRYWYLCSIQEIAQTYGMSESKTISLLYRMRNKLKEYLEKEGIIL